MDIIKLNEKSVNEFCRLRLQLFEELGEINSETDISKLETATKQYYLSHINKDLISWAVLYENNLVSIGSLCLFERIPYQENLTGLEGYILNIYTLPPYRKQGYAKHILNEIVTYSLKINIKRLWLNSSEKGHSLYAKYGFIKKDNEMELFLN